MKPTTIMLLAFGSIVLGHWANGKPAVSVKLVVEMGFVMIVISMMEGSNEAEPVAEGFAWLFLAATLLSSSSILQAFKTHTVAGKSVPSIGALWPTPCLPPRRSRWPSPPRWSTSWSAPT